MRKTKKRHGKSICCIYCTHLSTHITLIGKYHSHRAESVKFHISAFQAKVHSGKTCIGTCDLVTIKWGYNFEYLVLKS